MKIHTLHDPPSVYPVEKTVIRQGVIVREKSWRDTLGNELDKIGDKFVVTKAAPAPYRPPPLTFQIQKSFDMGEPDFWDDVMIIMGLVAFFIASFALGYVLCAVRCRSERAQWMSYYGGAGKRDASTETTAIDEPIEIPQGLQQTANQVTVVQA